MLLVIGDSNADAALRIPRFPREGDDVPLDDLAWSSGGAGVNVATGFARLDGAARLVSRVGGDPAAGVALAEAERAGVDLSFVQRDRERATGVCVVMVSPGGARTFLSYRGANAALEAPPAAAWEGVRGVHVCAHALLGGEQRQTALAAIAEAHRLSLPLSLDLCLPWIERAGPEGAGLLASFDVVLANEAELCALVLGERPTEVADGVIEDAARRARARGARVLVAKRGALGALVVTEDRMVAAPPFTVDAVDTTAAGDAFVAAFLWAVGRGIDLEGAARLANAAGAIQASRPGSAGALPARADLARFLEGRGEAGLFALLSPASP